MPIERPIRSATAVALATLLAAVPALASETITCESNGGRYHYCRIRTDNSVHLEHQLSRGDCRAFRDWGYDRNGVWVDNGCRAEFRVGRGGSHHDNKDIEKGVAAVAGVALIAALAAKNKENKEQEKEERSGDVPSWAVGTFSGFDGEERVDVELTIYPGGSVRGTAGRSDFTGDLDGIRLKAGRHTFDIERNGNGFLATDRDDSHHRVIFRRTGSGY